MKRFLFWLVPGGPVFLAALVLASVSGRDGGAQDWTGSLPWVLGGIGLVAAYFHRSRVVLFSLGLFCLVILAPPGTTAGAGLPVLGGILALSMGSAAGFQDRGVLSMPVLAQLAGLLLLLLFGWLLNDLAPGEVESFLARTPLPDGVTAWSGLPQPVFLAFLVGVSAAFLAALLRGGPVERGILWGLLCLALGLRADLDPGGVAVSLAGAGVILGLSVLETSYAMAYRDDLTGLPARRALMRDLQAMGPVYTAAMVDVDYFKRFNDRYGHDVGDQVLRMVASRLARAPGGARAYRYGGEEFTLLYPGKSLQQALPHLREVRRSVEEATFTLRSWRRPRKKPVDPGSWRRTGGQQARKLTVTVSIGGADTGGTDPSPEEVLKRADRALYRAKAAGRNRVAR